MRIQTGITAFLFFSAILTGSAGEANAQKTIYGTITDAESGEPLPVAHIRVEGRFQGTITNSRGEYELRVDRLPADISVTYIGFHSERIQISESSPDSLDIALIPNPVVLEEIIVTPEDPAVGIMREVIRRKQQWRAKLENFKADGYTRSSLANEERIATIVESISEVYWDAEYGTEETIISKRQTKNLGIEENFAEARIIPNLYDDDIDILGFKVIGLTHPDALQYYDFKLTGRRKRDDKTVFDISATPKKRLQPSFVGTLSVLDEDFAMIDVKAKPNDAIIFPVPLNNFAVSFEQQFDNFGSDFWLPVDVRLDGEIKLKFPGIKFPLIKYHQLTRLTGYEINTALPDSIFKEKIQKVEITMSASSNSASVGVRATVVPVDEIDSGSHESGTAETTPESSGISVKSETDSETQQAAEEARADSIFTASSLVVPYNAEEERAYAEIDSTDNLNDAFQPTGFLVDMFDNKDSKPKEQKKPSALKNAFGKISEPFSPQVSFNRVDGGSLGLKFETTLRDRYDIEATGLYRTALKDWAHGADLSYRWGKDKRGTIGIDYHVGTDSRHGSPVYPVVFNSAAVFAGHDDYYDYFHNERWGLRVGYSPRRIRSSFTLQYRNEQHSSLGKATDYAIFGKQDRRPNPAIEPGRLRSVTVSAKYGSDDVPFGLAEQKSAAFDIEMSSPDVLGSDFSFTKYTVQFDWRFNTFFRRRLLPNALDVRIMGGYTDGETVPQRYGALDGTLGVFGPFGVFRTLRNQPLEGKHYAAVFWEHNFRTVPFEFVGLRWFARKGIGIILHGASGRTWQDSFSDPLAAGFNHASHSFRHEIGFSVNSLFGFLRADVTKRLDRHGVFAGFGFARLF